MTGHFSFPADRGSRASIERARLKVANASHALGHWHRDNDSSTASKPYAHYGADAKAAIDAALRALYDARAALAAEIDTYLAERDAARAADTTPAPDLRRTA